MSAGPRDVRDSHHDPSGDMGVSSEREGHAGPGQDSTDGIRDVTPDAADVTGDPTGDATGDVEADDPPEQRPGAVETNPEGIPPKAGYPSRDPRSDG